MHVTAAVVSLVLVACSPMGAAAQDSIPATSRARQSMRLEHHGGIRIGIPHLIAIYAGTMQVQQSDWGGADGRTITAVLGFGGAQLGIGHGTRQHVSGRRAELTVLRTWGRPVIGDIHQTYVGAEIQMLTGIGAALGAYIRVEGRSDSNRAFLAASVLFGV